MGGAGVGGWPSRPPGAVSPARPRAASSCRDVLGRGRERCFSSGCSSTFTRAPVCSGQTTCTRGASFWPSAAVVLQEGVSVMRTPGQVLGVLLGWASRFFAQQAVILSLNRSIRAERTTISLFGIGLEMFFQQRAGGTNQRSAGGNEQIVLPHSGHALGRGDVVPQQIAAAQAAVCLGKSL